ncbi:TRP-domain-containing protein [Acrodontium crateriforme]|uniref:TRP-domain-containing protein n=1 Tax=Acrodontium crateriforme TaxID=150365 RepID=A0AAQ3R7D9_9PEZI|nr:TRP-domain-containing protein [Acrodontium crateriforme]
MIQRIHRLLLALCASTLWLNLALAKEQLYQYVEYSAPDGTTIKLLDDRQPALYTGDFGDCLGNSQINVTRFDAAYYKDNMTVLFHLAGNSGLQHSSVMMYIGVYAYGESRFDLVFNPCSANIDSLCPVNSSIPIEASGIIPVAPSDVANIPPIALSIPDFEGQAILRIFDNLTQSEIGCYSAVVTNGATFSHTTYVGSVLGIFTIVALVASFVTAAYGEAVPTMRLHYAHSLSVGVVFAVFQHIFYTGALSTNWPSVLVAWWSNFAWSGGMIPSASMQRSIDHLIGNNLGNLSQVGSAAAGSNQDGIAGGVDISLIYKRATQLGMQGMKNAAKHPLVRDIAGEIYRRPDVGILKRDIVRKSFERTLAKRDLVNSTTGYAWYGHPVMNGLPLPGNYSGFAGTLATQQIRASNAFMTGFLWFLILLVLMVGTVIAFKWTLEGLARIKLVKDYRFKFFRDHWLRYTGSVALRTCYIGWFMMMFLTIFQFTYQSSVGVKVIAAIAFVIFMVLIPGCAIMAVLAKKKTYSGETNSPTAQVERKMLLGRIFWRGHKYSQPAENSAAPDESSPEKNKVRFWNSDASHGKSIHDDENYTMRFGWLASRFRRTRWWFFTIWILYEFLRACFYGGASGHPMTQIFGLLVIEILAFAYIVYVRPFEGRRLNVIVVYCLGFSKVASVALSAAFDSRFNLPRITTTVIGIVIIVIQGILTIITMIAVVVGAMSSYMSISRNRENFKPNHMSGLREKYFNHLDRVVDDLPREPKPKKVKKSRKGEKEPVVSGFEMKGARRVAKIEDEDEEFHSQYPNASYLSIDRATPVDGTAAFHGISAASPMRRSRASSRAASFQSYSNPTLPFGARPHRASWSTRDFQDSTQVATATSREDTPDNDPAPPSPAASKFSHRRRSSRKEAHPSDQLRQQVSNDNLRVGGEVSTRDTIGRVPAPTIRPRAGTLSSRVSSRCGTPPPEEDEYISSAPETPAHRPAPSRQHALTPAQEADEFRFISPQTSHEAN